MCACRRRDSGGPCGPTVPSVVVLSDHREAVLLDRCRPPGAQPHHRDLVLDLLCRLLLAPCALGLPLSAARRIQDSTTTSRQPHTYNDRAPKGRPYPTNFEDHPPPPPTHGSRSTEGRTKQVQQGNLCTTSSQAPVQRPMSTTICSSMAQAVSSELAGTVSISRSTVHLALWQALLWHALRMLSPIVANRAPQPAIIQYRPAPSTGKVEATRQCTPVGQPVPGRLARITCRFAVFVAAARRGRRATATAAQHSHRRPEFVQEQGPPGRAQRAQSYP